MTYFFDQAISYRQKNNKTFLIFLILIKKPNFLEYTKELEGVTDLLNLNIFFRFLSENMSKALKVLGAQDSTTQTPQASSDSELNLIKKRHEKFLYGR